MDPALSEALTQAGLTIPPQVHKQINEKKIKDQVLKEVHSHAQHHTQGLVDSSAREPDPFPSVDLTGDDKDELMLVLDWLESIGLKIAPTVLRYESQNSEVTVDRKALSEQYHLNAESPTALLVQLVEERLKMLNIDRSDE
jgi:hypothetical protein